MKPLRSWTQVGLLLAISTWTALNSAHSDDPALPTAENSRPNAVSPDVVLEDEAKPAESKAASEVLLPEPESSLPTTTAMPPTGESDTPKPQVPMDLDAQFESPIEVNPQPANAAARSASSSPTKTSVQSQAEEAPAPSQPAPVPVTVEPVDPLVKLATEAVEVSSRRFLTADLHTPWQVIHGLLAYRQDFQLKTQDGRKINALEWASGGVTFRGESLFQKTPFGGRAHPFIQAYWFEGHPTQFMAYLTMCRLPTTHEFKTANGEVVTVQDIINNAKMEIVRDPHVELTWTLWALAHYLEPSAQWVNKNGEPWSMEELVRNELRNTIYDGPCGGTHSLFATAYARNAYLQTKQPLRGTWLEADQKIQRFIAEAKALQNPDGSFSIHFFKGRGYSNDFNTRITSSGHMIEWLMVALPQSRLSEPWIQNGIRCLAQDLIDNRHVNAECGPLYHAVDGLQIYRERMQIAARVAQRNAGNSSAVANGWKAAPTGQWPQSKTLVNSGRQEDSNRATTEIQPNAVPTPNKVSTSQSGVEIVVPKRSRPSVIAEQPSNTSRQ